jgi:ribosomal protein S18 acetylase RimI-like enzyme
MVPFRPEHIPLALELWQRTQHIGLSSADSPTALSKFLAANDGLSFCATHARELAGTILCGTDGRRGYIHHLAVATPLRRHRIGTSLLAKSLGALAAMSITKCHALVFRNDPYAELFWAESSWEHREDLLVYSSSIGGDA